MAELEGIMPTSTSGYELLTATPPTDAEIKREQRRYQTEQRKHIENNRRHTTVHATVDLLKGTDINHVEFDRYLVTIYNFLKSGNVGK